MKAVYPAVFMPEDKGEYSVIFPDLDGCATCGDDLTHAIEMAQEALGLYLVALEEHRHTIPDASSVDTIELKQGEFVTLIMVEVNQYRRNKTVNKTLTLPAWLNEAGEAAHVNFSGVLQEALKQKLGY
jgi:predicted RNase H-like HicB family nuclease